MTGGKVPTFATLGDWSVLYLLLNQDPPYQIDYYDASQIAEQEHMLSVLKKEDPQLLVWNPVFGVDNVPYWVRDPIIFTWAVTNYTHLEDAPQSSFILRRRPGEPIDYDWWRAHFPVPLDLGYLPALSNGAALSNCTSGSGCVPYAIVRGHPKAKGQNIVITVKGRGGAYPVSMKSLAKDQRHHTPSGWTACGSGRSSVPVRGSTMSTPGYTVQVPRKQAGDAPLLARTLAAPWPTCSSRAARVT